MVMMEGVHDSIGSALEAAAERVVVTLVVVVAHVSFVVDLDVGFDSYVCCGTAAFVLDVVGGIDAAAVVLLGNVELVLENPVVGLAAVVLDVDGVSDAATVNFDVNLGILVFGGTSVPGLTSAYEDKTREE